MDLASSLAQESESPIGSGTHGFFPLRAKIQAIGYTGGGIPVGRRMRRPYAPIGIVPTLARLVGIPAPMERRPVRPCPYRDAQGQAINLLEPKRERS